MRDVFKLTDSVGFHAGYLYTALQSALSSVLKSSGEKITAAQWPIMVMLWQKNGRSQHELTSAIHKDKTAITRNLDLLEKQNVIIRVQDKTDRRNNVIYLTKKGKDLEDILAAKVLDFKKVITKGIESEEIENMNLTMRKIYKNIKEYSK